MNNQTNINIEEFIECFDCGKKDRKQKFQGILDFMLCEKCCKIQGSLFMEYKNKKEILYPQYVEIQEGIYLGNQDAAMEEKTFQQTGITAVCVCGSYLNMPFRHKYEYKIYQISDHPQQQILKHFEQNFEWINRLRQDNKKILIHCAAGVSRSASFLIAYLMRSKDIKCQEAINFVKAKRPIICPNSGFRKQLEEYEEILTLNNKE